MRKLRLSARVALYFTGACAAFALTAQAQTQEGTAVVKLVKGTASYIDAIGITHPLTEGTVLRQGSIVKTGADSAVDLVMERNGRYVGLFEDSTLELTRLTFQPSPLGDVFDTQLNLKDGRVLLSVSKVLAGARYELKTPQALASVKGTEVYWDAKSGQFWVLSGLLKLEVTLLDVGVPPPPEEHSEKKTIEIPAGWSLFISREIDMVNFRNGLQPFPNGGTVPADVITRINNTPFLAGHYNNPAANPVTFKTAWFTELNPKLNHVNLIGLPAIVVPSP